MIPPAAFAQEQGAAEVVLGSGIHCAASSQLLPLTDPELLWVELDKHK